MDITCDNPGQENEDELRNGDSALIDNGFSGYKFILYTLSLSLALIGMLFAATYVTDPYGEHGSERGIYFKANQNTISRYQEYLSNERHFLIFGTSRSHLFSDRHLGQKVLNFYAVYGWPRAVLGFLSALDQRQIKNISGILYLIDLHTFGAPPPLDDYRPLDRFDRIRNHLSNLRWYVKDSLTKLYRIARGSGDFHVHARGFKIEDTTRRWDGAWRATWQTDSQAFDRAEIARLAEVKAFASRHGIPIMFITPTLPEKTVKEFVNVELLRRQRRYFVEAIGEYYELTSMPGVSDHMAYFSDHTHLNQDGANALFATYPWNDRRVTAANIDGVLNEFGTAGR